MGRRRGPVLVMDFGGDQGSKSVGYDIWIRKKVRTWQFSHSTIDI